MSDILDNTVSFWLGEISAGIDALVGHFLGGKMDATQKKQWEGLIDSWTARRDALRPELRSVTKDLVAARSAYAKDPTVENHQRLEELTERQRLLREQVDLAVQRLGQRRKQYREILRAGQDVVFKSQEGFNQAMAFGEAENLKRGIPIPGVYSSEDMKEMAFRKARKSFPMQLIPEKRSALHQTLYGFLKSKSTSQAVDPQVLDSFVQRFEKGQLTDAEKQSLEQYLQGKKVPSTDPLFQQIHKPPTEGSFRGGGNNYYFNFNGAGTEEVAAQVQKLLNASGAMAG